MSSKVDEKAHFLAPPVVEGYLYALEAAHTASDSLEAKEADLAAAKAKAKVGETTIADVLTAAEDSSVARLELYPHNLDLAAALGSRA